MIINNFSVTILSSLKYKKKLKMAVSSKRASYKANQRTRTEVYSNLLFKACNENKVTSNWSIILNLVNFYTLLTLFLP